MFRLMVVAIFIAPMLLGCAATANLNGFHAAQMACATGSSSERERAVCVNAAEDTYLRPSSRYPSLIDEEERYRLVLGDKVDAKEMTHDEAALAFQQYHNALDAEARQNNYQNVAAAIAIMNGTPRPEPTAQSLMPPQPTYPPHVYTTNCSTIGAYMNCSTQ